MTKAAIEEFLKTYYEDKKDLRLGQAFIVKFGHDKCKHTDKGPCLFYLPNEMALKSIRSMME